MTECRWTGEVAAHVLGALDPDEARSFEAHAETCAECRREIAQFSGVVDALPVTAPQIAPPPELKHRIMAVVDAEAALLRAAGPEADRPVAVAPRRRRWRFRLAPFPAAALASVLLAIGVAGGLLLGGGDDGASPAPVSTYVAEAPGGAKVLVEVSGGRAELVLENMPEPPRDRVWQVWLREEGRAPEPSATLFTTAPDGRTRVAIAEDVTDYDTVLVTAEPRGGSREPTSSPVIAANLT